MWRQSYVPPSSKLDQPSSQREEEQQRRISGGIDMFADERDAVDDRDASFDGAHDSAQRNRNVWAAARLWDELLQHACAQPDNLAGALKVCGLTSDK
jgi:hypothetical protein